ncbi:MAG: hypothetical protein ACYC8T_22010 [Myxococcaceae bacterium]
MRHFAALLAGAALALSAAAHAAEPETDKIKDAPIDWSHRPGEFKGKKILMVTWYSEGGTPESAPLDRVPGVLRRMGFTVDLRVSPKELPPLDGYDQLWLIAGGGGSNFGAKDLERIQSFLARGKGLYSLNDNTPYTSEGNVLGKGLHGIHMQGGYVGQQMIHVVSPGTVKKLVEEAYASGNLDKLADLRRAGYLNGKLYAEDHELLSGIERIYEGSTICAISASPDLEVILRASDNQSLVAVSTKKGETMLYDCGFTRLYYQWDQHADTATRWYQNVAAYLQGKRRADLAQPAPSKKS